MYVLHYAPDNASLIIRLALLEAGLPFQTALVDRSRRQQDSAAYKQLNPAGLIPVLVTDEGPIAETGAILLWLADRHGQGLAPNVAKGTFLQWLFFLSNTVHADIRHLFYPELYVGPEGAEGHHARISGRMAKHFTLLEQTAAKDTGLFQPPSVLTLYLVTLLRWVVLYPRNEWFRLADYPTLSALCRTMDQRASTADLIIAEGLDPNPFSEPKDCHPATGSAL